MPFDFHQHVCRFGHCDCFLGGAHRRGAGCGGLAPQEPVPDYADESVSTKVVKIIQSYTGIVDKMVWRKR